MNEMRKMFNSKPRRALSVLLLLIVIAVTGQASYYIPRPIQTLSEAYNESWECIGWNYTSEAWQNGSASTFSFGGETERFRVMDAMNKCRETASERNATCVTFENDSAILIFFEPNSSKFGFNVYVREYVEKNECVKWQKIRTLIEQPI